MPIRLLGEIDRTSLAELTAGLGPRDAGASWRLGDTLILWDGARVVRCPGAFGR